MVIISWFGNSNGNGINGVIMKQFFSSNGNYNGIWIHLQVIVMVIVSWWH